MEFYINIYIYFFLRSLFKRSPSYQLQFDRFAHVPLEELESNVHFLAHSFRTGFAFNTAIEHLKTPEELHKILADLGEKHRKFHLTAEHFEVNNNQKTKKYNIVIYWFDFLILIIIRELFNAFALTIISIIYNILIIIVHNIATVNYNNLM
jgi:hypothetical protein